MEEAVNRSAVQSLMCTMEGLIVEMEMLQNLLTLYAEHREDQITHIRPSEAWTVECVLRRQDLGLALLRAIEEKVQAITKEANQVTADGYALCGMAYTPA